MTSNLLDTVNLYTRREGELTEQISNIVLDISEQTRKASNLSDKTSKEKDEVKKKYEVGSDAYKQAMDNVEDNFDLNLAIITKWESNLSNKKNVKETDLKTTTNAKESTIGMLKQDIPVNGRYGGTGGT